MLLMPYHCADELPAFEAEADCVNDKLQAHRGHHATVQTLRLRHPSFKNRIYFTEVCLGT